MKKLIFTVSALLSLVSVGFSQQIPLSSTYIYNKFTINPALAGMYSRPQLYLMHRNQWTDMPGNPTTSMVTIESALKNDKIGLGAAIYNDAIGISNTIGVKFAYAYKLKLATESYLDMGLGFGVNRLGIDFSKVNVLNPDDQAFYDFSAMNKITFDGTGGLNFNWRKVNVGVAIPNLVNTKARFHSNDSIISSSSYFTYARHLAFTVSDEFQITKDGKNSITPSILFKRDLMKKPGAPFTANSNKRPYQLDIVAMYDYMKKYMLGVSYRTDYGVTAQVGIKLLDQLTLGYAYDFHTNSNWKGSNLVGQTHEFLLGYQFGKDKDVLLNRVNKLDTAVQETVQKTNDLDSTVKDTKKKMEKMNNDLRKREDDNFQNLKKEIDKTNGDVDELRKKMNSNGGGTYTLSRIYFKTDKSDLLPGSVAELDELVEVMTKYPNMKIKITGHADSRNGETYNQKLSEKRAKAVYDYLVSKGIAADRLEYEGVGAKLPIGDNNTDAGQQLNRRVQFKVTQF